MRARLRRSRSVRTRTRASSRAHPWFRYNLQNDHQVYPTFDVYLIRKGDDVYKVQLTGYYGAAGEARHIGIRWSQLD